MKHFTTFLDQSPDKLSTIVTKAIELKEGRKTDTIRGKNFGMVFFNPSLRTRVSFETAMYRFGGNAIALAAGGDMWTLESQEGAIMNGNKTEHIKDAAPVLSRYCNAIGIRTFAGLKNLQDDLKEEVISTFRKYATVPVVSMESAMEHPCQALADMMTIREKFKEKKKLKFTLSWAPHIKALPMAVPNSALLAAATLGMDITVAHPPGFELADRYLDHARTTTVSLGGSLKMLNSQDGAFDDADVVYAKNWAPSAFYAEPKKIEEMLAAHTSWMVTGKALKPKSLFMHCLPVRRNVEVSDEVLDSPQSGIYNEAENRMWAQAALLEDIFKV